MKDEIKETLDSIRELVEQSPNRGFYGISHKKWKQLLDYITNLQKELNYYITHSEEQRQELHRLNEQHKNNKKKKSYLKKDLKKYKSRNEKTIENIDLVIKLIKQQPTEDDTWILNKLNGFKYLLEGENKDVKD